MKRKERKRLREEKEIERIRYFKRLENKYEDLLKSELGNYTSCLFTFFEYLENNSLWISVEICREDNNCYEIKLIDIKDYEVFLDKKINNFIKKFKENYKPHTYQYKGWIEK